MKMLFLLLFASFLFCRALTAAADPVLEPNDRLAICGDGMTNSEGYSVYIEDYLLMNQPIPGLDVAEFGWGAGDPAGFLARLNTDLLPFKPTVVLTSFNSGDVNTRAKAQTDLVEALKKAGVRTIVIGSPKCVDSYDFQHDPAKAAAENKLLGTLAGIDKDVAAREGALYADVYGITMSAMIKAKALHGESYVLESDGDVFNMAIASAYLKALGCDGNIGTITIDFATGKAEATAGQEILSFKDNTLKLESTRYPFWFPGHNVGPDYQLDTNLQCIPFNEELNRYTLIVKNLPTAQTKVYWGDGYLDFSAGELARGINLPATMPAGNPFGSQASGADNGVRGQQQVERILGEALVQGRPDAEAGAKREAAFQIAKGRISPIQTTIRLQPLAEPDKQPPGPIPVILDTDIDGDVDDVGALALLNDFMDQGEVNLIACVHDNSNAQLSSCATIQAVNAYYGHPSIPIGQYFGDAGPSVHMTSVLLPAPADAHHAPDGPYGSSYTLQIHQRFDPGFPNDDKLPAAIDVYRNALASAADGSVVICCIGSMAIIQDLIQSQPDSVSNLSGLDLARKKVRELVIMSNTAPQDCYLHSKWPTKIIWSTDIGNYVYPGASLVNTPENNPVRIAYHLFGADGGRQGWDLTAAWLAGRGTGDVYDLVAGRQQYINDITHTPPGPHPNDFTATVRMPSPEVLKLINAELARPPKF